MPIPAQGGIAKVSMGMLFFDLAQHLTPSLAGYLNQAFPILGLEYSFEVVVAAESLFGGFVVWATPQHLLQFIIDFIAWARSAKKQIDDALDKPLT